MTTHKFFPIHQSPIIMSLMLYNISQQLLKINHTQIQLFYRNKKLKNKVTDVLSSWKPPPPLPSSSMMNHLSQFPDANTYCNVNYHQDRSKSGVSFIVLEKCVTETLWMVEYLFVVIPPLAKAGQDMLVCHYNIFVKSKFSFNLLFTILVKDCRKEW
jgi:hypothetical protein